MGKFFNQEKFHMQEKPSLATEDLVVYIIAKMHSAQEEDLCLCPPCDQTREETIAAELAPYIANLKGEVN